MRIRPIVAYQLSLFGDAPKAGGAWIPPIYMLYLCGMPMGYESEEKRQYRLAFPYWTSFLPAFRQ